jgi:NarL family two-component system response regulator LiaR
VQPLRIAIVNDYEVVVAGLARMLTPYADRVQVVELDANRPVASRVDVALYDTFAQVRDHTVDCRSIIADKQAAKVVIYSWNPDPEVACRSLAEGAAGYLLKRMPADDLVDALERVHAGETVVIGGDGANVGGAGGVGGVGGVATGVGDWPGRDVGLSERESEILALIVQGLRNQELADRSYLSINTVKSYIRSAYRKMGVSSRSQAVLWGIDHGFRADRSRLRVVDAEAL